VILPTWRHDPLARPGHRSTSDIEERPVQLFQNGHALIVGVGSDDIPTTARDAQAIHQLLTDPTLCAYDPERVELLVRQAATREGILAGLDRLAERLEDDPEATAIVYFSGHGMAGPPHRLVTAGYSPARLEQTTIPSSQLTGKLRAIRAKKLLVLLDCCHAGGQADAKEPHWQKLPVAALEELARGGGRVVLASSRPSEYSYTSEPYSFFTQTLREALAGHGASEYDGYTRVLDVALYTAHEVATRTREQQHPVLKVADLEGNFKLSYYAAGEPQPKTRQVPVERGRPPVVGLDGQLSEEARGWQQELEESQGQLMHLEMRLRDYSTPEALRREIRQDWQQTVDHIDDLKGRLGLLAGQSPYGRTLTRLWTFLGVLAFYTSYNLFAQSQGWPRLLWQDWAFDSYAVAPPAMFLGIPLLHLAFLLTRLYPNPAMRPGLLRRLPLAFGLPLYAQTHLRRHYQAFFLAVFLLVPLGAQVHFYSKIFHGTVEKREDGKCRDLRDGVAWHATGWQHLTKPIPFGEATGDCYRLGGKDQNVTFFPFWEPWGLLLLELSLFAHFVLMLRELAKAPPGKPADLPSIHHQTDRDTSIKGNEYVEKSEANPIR
jgi:Caspase domain